ncbi:MAG: aspartate--ammonia ligase [Ruminococcaceae bacterium]|nr:aspartate--ammonia ligase [Oscillospiraceae bacterium]
MGLKNLIIPKDYKNILGLIETQKAIKLIKDNLERILAENLNLIRVSAPMTVRPETGLNDDLTGRERAVTFDVPDAGFDVQIVQSLAKWKRYALSYYGFDENSGIYTDMNALRRDEVLDNLHSIYVDQWDWEKIISREERNIEYLKSTVKKIVDSLRATENILNSNFDLGSSLFNEEPYFITSQELLDKYPDLNSHNREDKICKKHGIVFIIGIGAPLSDGKPHDTRAADYDDWSLNGDLLVWYPLLNRSVELSSMGIRVDEDALRRQLLLSGSEYKSGMSFHKSLLSGELPLTIGGGIGQSRVCMLMLQKAHIGEVQASVWDDKTVKSCLSNGINLL